MDKKLNLEELKKKPIIIFPFGPDGKAAAETLINHGYNIVAFWDNFRFGEEYNGIPVKKPSTDDNSSVVLICARFSMEHILLKQTKELNCKLVYLWTDVISNIDLSYEEKNKNYNTIHQKLFKNNLEKLKNEKDDILYAIGYLIKITDRCSLNCKNCIGLKPYYKSTKDFNTDITIKNIEHLLKSVDYIYKLSISGGEPFICKDLHIYVDYLVKQNNIGIVHIVTNGTIIPTYENLSCLKNEKVFVEISDYGKHSTHINDLEKIFKNEGINYRKLERSGWTEISIKKHNRTEKQLRDVYKNCLLSAANPEIRDGKLFPCGFLSSLYALQAIPKEEYYYIDLMKYDNEELRKKIIEFQQKTFMYGCDYCNGFCGDKTQVVAAEQIDYIIPYKNMNNDD